MEVTKWLKPLVYRVTLGDFVSVQTAYHGVLLQAGHAGRIGPGCICAERFDRVCYSGSTQASRCPDFREVETGTLCQLQYAD
jgi:hypothetical protein